MRRPDRGRPQDFHEVPADVCEAGEQLHERVGFGVGFVNHVAVALDVSGEISADGLDQLFATPPGPPMVKEAALRIAGDPHVSARCFPAARNEVSHGSFINLEVAGGKGFGFDRRGDRFEQGYGLV